jgi:hypothetical protein
MACNRFLCANGDGDVAVHACNPLPGFAPRQSERNMDRQSPPMNWVVVTGKNGNRVLRMKWVATEEC